MSEDERKRNLSHRSMILSAAGMPPSVRTPFVPVTAPEVRLRPHEAGQPRAVLCLALIATRNYLPFAQVAARSFLQHHPSAPVFLLMPDGAAGDAALFPEGTTFVLDDLGVENAGWYLAKYTATEFSNALKPAFLSFLGGHAERAVYLDTDIAVFSPMTELIESLDVASLVLVPHMLAPFPRPEQFWVRPRTADIFNSGFINAGCFAIRLRECDEFLRKWHEYNTSPGAFFIETGYQTDQQFLNWALMMVPDALVLRSTRYNVAYWNLHDRNLRVEYSGSGDVAFTVDHQPLAFFHFSGYDINDKMTLSRHDGRCAVYDMPAVAEILNWFSDAVLSTSTMAFLGTEYGFERWANGFMPNRLIRELLKRYEPYLPAFDVRRAEFADQLCARLMDPLPASGSMLPLVAAEIYDRRPDLQSAFPGAHTGRDPTGYWYWFCRHAGSEFGINFLIDKFRRMLASDAAAVFVNLVTETIDANPPLQFLSTDRQSAADQLQAAGRGELVAILLEAQTEWSFFTDMGAVLAVYERRPDLQKVFPDIFGRSHQAFSEWLVLNGWDEQGVPASAIESFQRRSAARVLARIYSYVARRSDLVDRRCEALLLDDLSPLLKELVRGSGEGLEYDLDDLVVLQFIHHKSRHLLVPLYLELPYVRRRSSGSRLKEDLDALLPESIRSLDWTMRGRRDHYSCFDRFAVMLDQVLDKRLSSTVLTGQARELDVMHLLRQVAAQPTPVSGLHPEVRTAASRIALKAAKPGEHLGRLNQREISPAINLFGYFFTDNGVGESSRGLATALELLRPVNRIPLYSSHVQEFVTLPQLFQQYDHLSDTNVFVSYPHQREDLLGVTPLAWVAGRRNIVHLAWEQKDSSPWWLRVYDRYDEIWAISEFAATPFRKMFPGRVRVVPNVLPFERYPTCARSARVAGKVVTFLFVFDANSSIERKNPEGVIAAFAMAFKGRPEAKAVRLTLKVGGLDRAEHAGRVGRLRQQARDAGLDIQFDGRHLSREALMRLIAETDCYVSLHRAEGFGYTMAEAMYYGVPVIASGYSGNLEYMDSGNSFLVPCEEAFVKTPDGPFQHGSIWGEPDVGAAADFMRFVVDNPARAQEIGSLGSTAVRNKLSAAAVARAVAKSFESYTPQLVAAD